MTNVYDAANNRIGQFYGTNSVVYIVNPNAKLPQVLMWIKNGVTNYYVYGPGLLYQVTETATVTNTLTYHYDYRGSTVALSGDNGLVTDRMEYSLYGTMTYHAGTNDTPFLFNGQYGVMSDPNGLLFMQARYYSPFLCRFVNPDPLGFSGGMNFYAYGNGNPASMTDPSGTDASSTSTTDGNDTTSFEDPTSTILDIPPDPSDPFGINAAQAAWNAENNWWVNKALDDLAVGAAFLDLMKNNFGQEFLGTTPQQTDIALLGLAPQIGAWDTAEGGTQALLPMADASFNTGTIRTIAGYEVAGNAGLVGQTYNFNIWGLYATENSQGPFALVNALNSEESAAGASQISITDNSVINQGLLNISPGVAGRLGFQFQQVNPTTNFAARSSPLIMTEPEKLKSTLMAIFKRKGQDGQYTRLFEDLEPSQRESLLKEVPLRTGELPVIGSAESQDTWLIVTTDRIVWRLKGKTQTLSVDDVWHVKADFQKMVAIGIRKHQLRELQIETVAHEQHTIEVEEGAPLMGVWNALMNLGARNRKKE